MSDDGDHNHDEAGRLSASRTQEFDNLTTSKGNEEQSDNGNTSNTDAFARVVANTLYSPDTVTAALLQGTTFSDTPGPCVITNILGVSESGKGKCKAAQSLEEGEEGVLRTG